MESIIPGIYPVIAEKATSGRNSHLKISIFVFVAMSAYTYFKKTPQICKNFMRNAMHFIIIFLLQIFTSIYIDCIDLDVGVFPLRWSLPYQMNFIIIKVFFFFYCPDSPPVTIQSTSSAPHDDQLQLQVQALMHQNSVLRNQLETIKVKDESASLAPPGTTPSSGVPIANEEMETQIKALQHSLLSMQQVCDPAIIHQRSRVRELTLGWFWSRIRFRVRVAIGLVGFKYMTGCGSGLGFSRVRVKYRIFSSRVEVRNLVSIRN